MLQRERRREETPERTAGSPAGQGGGAAPGSAGILQRRGRRHQQRAEHELHTVQPRSGTGERSVECGSGARRQRP